MAKVPTVPALTVGDANAAIARFGREPRTIGVPLLPPDAPRDAWLARRRTLVTASEIAAVLGRSPHDSPFSLWWRKQPDWPEPETPRAAHIGLKLEAVIGELWAEAHPEAALFRPGAALWGHYEHTWLGATPDYFGVFASEDGKQVWAEPVECKSDEGGEGWGHAGTDEIPFHHLCQLVMQCYVTGARFGHLIRLAGKRVTEYRVDMHDHTQLVTDMINAGQAFHASLSTGLAPDVDAHPATTDALQTLYGDVEKGAEAPLPDELVAVYLEAHAAAAAWKTRLAEAQNRIREILGRHNAQYGVRVSDGERIVTRSHYKRNGYMVQPSEVDQIRKSR